MSETIDVDAIHAAQADLHTVLSAIPVQSVTPVHPLEVKARTHARATPDCEPTDVVFRLKTPPLSDITIFEHRGDVITHVRNQLHMMDCAGETSDTHLVATDFPPRHIKTKPLVFYANSTL